MKRSKTESFRRYAQFARDVAAQAYSPTAQAHWLSIAEFWTLHSDAYDGPKEVKKPLSAFTSNQAPLSKTET